MGSESGRDMQTTGPGEPSKVRDDVTPIILARPRPRKRQRPKSIGEFEEDEVRYSLNGFWLGSSSTY